MFALLRFAPSDLRTVSLPPAGKIHPATASGARESFSVSHLIAAMNGRMSLTVHRSSLQNETLLSSAIH